MSDKRDFGREHESDDLSEFTRRFFDESKEKDLFGNDSLHVQRFDKDGEILDAGEDDDFLKIYESLGKNENTPAPAAQKENLDRGPDDFEIDFDFDKEYEPPREDKVIKRNTSKRTGCMGGIMYFAFIVGVSLILACLAWMAASDVLAFGKPDSEVTVTIPKDFDMGDVTDILYENDLIKYKFLFKMYTGFSSADEKITGGTYKLNTNYDYRALVNGMTASGGVKVETDVTIPEGYTLRQIFQVLEENKVCYADDLWETAANHAFDYDFLDDSTLGNKTRLEGYLFPDTYTFYVNDSPEKVINKMLSNFDNKFTDEMKARLDEMGYSMHEVITVASMIEKEAGADSERADIASVIYNRLKSSSFPYLQIDATIYYGIAETGEEFSTEANTPYNTYTNEGLPPGPISNPGIASIKAALNPNSTNYYYYALGTEGVHSFFKTLDAFNKFVNSDQYGG